MDCGLRLSLQGPAVWSPNVFVTLYNPSPGLTFKKTCNTVIRVMALGNLDRIRHLSLQKAPGAVCLRRVWVGCLGFVCHASHVLGRRWGEKVRFDLGDAREA